MTTVTNQFISLVNLQPAVLLTMAKFKKPADCGFLGQKSFELAQAAMLVKQKDFKCPPNHMQTVIDGMQMFQFPFFEGDALKDTFKDFFDQISFYGNKVLNLNKDLDTKWFEAFKAVNQAILSFVLINTAKVSTWSGSQDGSGA